MTPDYSTHHSGYRKDLTDHEAIIEIHTVLLGANGDDGLVGDVKRCAVAIKEESCELSKLKKIVYTLVGVLVGSGVITGGAIGIDKLVTK